MPPARLAAQPAAEQTLLDLGAWEPWGDRGAQAARTLIPILDLAPHGQSAQVLWVPPGCPAIRRRCERQVALLTVIMHVTDRMSASLKLLLRVCNYMLGRLLATKCLQRQRGRGIALRRMVGRTLPRAYSMAARLQASSLDTARSIMKPVSAAGRSSGAPLPPPVAALFGYRPESVPVRLAARLFGPELAQLPAALSLGLARWLQAPSPCVETCTRGGCQLTLQVIPSTRYL